MGRDGMSVEHGGAESPTTLTGVVSGRSVISAVGPSGVAHSVWPSTAGTTSTSGSTTTSSYRPVKKKKLVNLPSRFTKKVLVAFVDEENPDNSTNVVWAANLEPDLIEMTNRDGEAYLTITLSLEDVYGNLEDPNED